MTTLNGKTALVTGSTSGIGLGIALSLAKAGANLTTDSFIKEPISFMTQDDWTPWWCSNPPESAHYPVGRTAPPGTAPRLHPITRKLQGPHESCMQGGATLTVNWAWLIASF